MGLLRPLRLLRLCIVFIPEEILALGLLLLRSVCREDRFKGVWIVASVEHLGGHGHRRRREVLHLL